MINRYAFIYELKEYNLAYKVTFNPYDEVSNNTSIDINILSRMNHCQNKLNVDYKILSKGKTMHEEHEHKSNKMASKDNGGKVSVEKVAENQCSPANNSLRNNWSYLGDYIKCKCCGEVCGSVSAVKHLQVCGQTTTSSNINTTMKDPDRLFSITKSRESSSQRRSMPSPFHGSSSSGYTRCGTCNKFFNNVAAPRHIQACDESHTDLRRVTYKPVTSHIQTCDERNVCLSGDAENLQMHGGRPTS